jgi:integrase
MVGCGCRCVEVSRARVEDFDPIGRTVRLVGKGGHERVIPVPVEAAKAIGAHLDVQGRTAGPLFRSRRDGGPIRTETMSRYVRCWMIEAGVKVRPLDGRSAHGLRRTAGSDVMERSGDLRAVQEMLGHASIETTARHYLRSVTMEQLRTAMEGRGYDAA